MSRRRTGFTLMEVVIAIAIASIIAASLYGALSIAFASRDTVKNQMTAPREAAIALEVARRDFASVVPIEASGPINSFVGTSSTSISGNADGAEFFCLGKSSPRVTTDLTGQPIASDPSVAAPAGEPTREGLRRVRLYLEVDQQRPDTYLLLRQVDDNVFADTPTEMPPEVLLSGVTSMEMRYFDSVGWASEWDSITFNNALPLAVEMTLTLAPVASEGTPPGQSSSPPYRVTQILPLSMADPAALAATGGDSGLSFP